MVQSFQLPKLHLRDFKRIESSKCKLGTNLKKIVIKVFPMENNRLLMILFSQFHLAECPTQPEASGTDLYEDLGSTTASNEVSSPRPRGPRADWQLHRRHSNRVRQFRQWAAAAAATPSTTTATTPPWQRQPGNPRVPCSSSCLSCRTFRNSSDSKIAAYEQNEEKKFAAKKW